MSDLSDGDQAQPEPFTLLVRRFPSGATAIYVSGVLSGDAGDELNRVIDEALQVRPTLLALELSGVESFDHAGVQALVSAALLAEEAKVSLCLVGVEEGPVQPSLAMAKQAGLFDTFASVTEAVAYSR